MTLQLKEISKDKYILSGKRDIWFEYQKQVVVDGEVYSKLWRDIKEIDIETLEQREIIIDEIKIINPITISYPIDFPSMINSAITRGQSDNFYVPFLYAACELSKIKRYYGTCKKSNIRESWTEQITQNRFSYPIHEYGFNNVFYFDYTFEEIIEYDLLSYFHKMDKSNRFFLPINTEFEKTDRLINFINLRMSYLTPEAAI